MIQILRILPQRQLILPIRTYKNFGHKRQKIPLVTTLWHGFLTFSFIGLGINWNKISHFIFGDEEIDMNDVIMPKKEPIK